MRSNIKKHNISLNLSNSSWIEHFQARAQSSTCSPDTVLIGAKLNTASFQHSPLLSTRLVFPNSYIYFRNLQPVTFHPSHLISRYWHISRSPVRLFETRRCTDRHHIEYVENPIKRSLRVGGTRLANVFRLLGGHSQRNVVYSDAIDRFETGQQRRFGKSQLIVWRCRIRCAAHLCTTICKDLHCYTGCSSGNVFPGRWIDDHTCCCYFHVSFEQTSKRQN